MAQVKVLGRNVAVKVEGNKILVEMDLSAKGEVSASGKSTVIASSKGNQTIAVVDGKVFKLGVNLFAQ
jgi:Fe-S cluster assembly ATPase SufC